MERILSITGAGDRSAMRAKEHVLLAWLLGRVPDRPAPVNGTKLWSGLLFSFFWLSCKEHLYGSAGSWSSGQHVQNRELLRRRYRNPGACCDISHRHRILVRRGCVLRRPDCPKRHTKTSRTKWPLNGLWYIYLYCGICSRHPFFVFRPSGM